ncbi:MAG: gamma-glutamyl-gamma-aminobutyrate hydrolase family protein [Candidatus Paceibacterota bacterium]|jgi:GMP synthase-like glutamine amidotransferase
MKTLLIDNETTLLESLERVIPGTVTVRRWDNLQDISTKPFDLVVLSGGSRFEIEGNEEKLRDEILIIRDTSKPLIGICFGCELIVTAFGGTIEEMTNQEKGPVAIEITPGFSPIFGSGTGDFTVYENHRWHIKDMPEGFDALASSSHGIELIKHKTLPIIGLQFHPEKVIENGKGPYIFDRILREITGRS